MVNIKTAITKVKLTNPDVLMTKRKIATVYTNTTFDSD